MKTTKSRSKKVKAGRNRNQTLYVQTRPPKKLLKLLKEGCDGGDGEFDEFLPRPIRKLLEKNDSNSWFPVATTKGTVEWSVISHGPL